MKIRPTTYVLDMAALEGRPVLQGHADVCTDLGHAWYKLDDKMQDWCPRCGEPTPAPVDASLVRV